MSDTVTTKSDHQSAVRTEGLTRKFGELIAVDDVSLSVPEGELRAIIGPNGAGKTTLFNLITGTLEPTAGTVSFHGDDITALATEDRAQQGLVRSYQSNELFFEETVLENVRLASQTADLGSFTFNIFSRATEYNLERAEELLDLLDLTAERNTKAKNLSHGDQRKLAIAIMLATNPDTLLLDEPTSGMGTEATKRTAQLIADIHEEFELTILLIEHDMSVVMNISDRISVLNQGSLLTTDEPEQIQEDDEVQEAYLGGLEDEEVAF